MQAFSCTALSGRTGRGLPLRVQSTYCYSLRMATRCTANFLHAPLNGSQQIGQLWICIGGRAQVETPLLTATSVGSYKCRKSLGKCESEETTRHRNTHWEGAYTCTQTLPHNLHVARKWPRSHFPFWRCRHQTHECLHYKKQSTFGVNENTDRKHSRDKQLGAEL